MTSVAEPTTSPDGISALTRWPPDALKPGDPAPNFELMDENKNVVKLSDLRGRKVVLLFYPTLSEWDQRKL